MARTFALLTSAVLSLTMTSVLLAQPASPRKALRGSLVEDRAARKLLEAGDTRYESDEVKEAVEVWKSVIERYPRSRVRFQAHMRLGNHFLERERAYDRSRVQFEAVLSEENRDEDQQAEALLKVGVCFYEARLFGKCFQVMRDVIEKYPVSPQVNQAYHYIGLGHFQLGHYSRAIAALEKVGTALDGEDVKGKKVVAGKRLFVKIDDTDLSALEADEVVKVVVEATSGDKESVTCYPVGRNVRVVLGTIVTRLGKPRPNSGQLEVKGDDHVKIVYIDRHTADKKVDQDVIQEIEVVGDAHVAVKDGAFSENLLGVVMGKPVNVQVSDPDRDLTDEADAINAVVEIYRQKTELELEAEAADLAAKELGTEEGEKESGEESEDLDLEEEEQEIDRFKLVDRVELNLIEAQIKRQLASNIDEPEVDGAEAGDAEAAPATEEGAEEAKPEAAAEEKPEADADTEAKPEAATDETTTEEEKEPAPFVEDGSIHTGVFRGNVSLVRADEIIEGDAILQSLPGDVLRVTYIDEKHMGEGIREVLTKARCVEGNLGGVRVTKAVISDAELRLKTRLKTAAALTNIGNRYKEFGLKKSADSKYGQALGVCDEIMREASRLGGRVLEETYVQLWKIYFEMDRLELAGAMAQRLQAQFPTSGFVDDALLQLADVARKQGDLQRAIGIYGRLVRMQTSQLRGEAQFGIAECYEKMAEDAQSNASPAMLDRSFQEYKKVFDQFPQSGRVGEAVAKMANYYYKQKDYARAVDTFDTVLNEHPDAKFLDVVLFNYGRCLYRMGRKGEARQRFDQLIGDYPQSALATDAKKISDALRKSGT